MNHFITINGKILDVSRPIVMGIINITPDSFFTNSSKNFVEATEKPFAKVLLSLTSEVIPLALWLIL